MVSFFRICTQSARIGDALHPVIEHRAGTLGLPLLVKSDTFFVFRIFLPEAGVGEVGFRSGFAPIHEREF